MLPPPSVPDSIQGCSQVHVFFCKVLFHVVTLSINVFFCLPLLLFPSTSKYRAFAGNLLPSFLTACPNHVNLLLLILLTSVSVCLNSLRMTLLGLTVFRAKFDK